MCLTRMTDMTRTDSIGSGSNPGGQMSGLSEAVPQRSCEGKVRLAETGRAHQVWPKGWRDYPVRPILAVWCRLGAVERDVLSNCCR
jgi:hypothetical protein